MAVLSIGVILGGLVAIGSLAIEVLLAIWTYRDAESKGMIPVLWTAIVVLVPSFIGLIVYLVVRSENTKIICSNCNTRVNSNMKYCSNCGMELKPADIDLDKQEAFKSSQKKLIIGIFIALGINIICSVMMIVSFIIGTVRVAEKAVDMTRNINIEEITEDFNSALSEIDRSLGNGNYNVTVKDDVVIITNNDGEEILRVDGKSDEVNINGKELQKYIKDVSGNDTITDDEIDKIKDDIKDAIIESLEDNKDSKDIDD